MNYVSLLGRISKDLELTYTQNGKSVLKFSIAVPKETNREEADFINCVAWEKRAETIAEYFKKGSRILVSGRLSVNSYEKDGERRYFTEVIVTNFDFIESKNQSYDNTNLSANMPKPSSNESFVEDDEDDFPF